VGRNFGWTSPDAVRALARLRNESPGETFTAVDRGRIAGCGSLDGETTMTTRSLKRFERLLLEERHRAMGDLADAEQDLQAYAESSANGPEIQDRLDLVSDRMAAEAGATIAERESAELEDIDAALRELYHSPQRFGRCEICNRPIGESRLVLLPTTRRCARHGHWRRRVA
jgi:RNA polymerase-binding transcription factor DksA